MSENAIDALANQEGFEMRLMAEIQRKGSTRNSIASLYREAIIFGGNNAVDWARVNQAILGRYTVSGLNYIKYLAWGVRRAAATKPQRSPAVTTAVSG